MAKKDLEKKRRAAAGHQEIQGETIAKFELFDHEWNPYSRYLDNDKVDLILRKRVGKEIIYKEIQVKYGRLYLQKSENIFDTSSWKPNILIEEFKERETDINFFVIYVLSHPEGVGYTGDIFIFPIKNYIYLVSEAIKTKRKEKLARKLQIARLRNSNKWYIMTDSYYKSKPKDISKCIDVTEYRRNFDVLEELK